MFARIGTFEMPSSNLEKVSALLRDKIVIAFSKHNGFLGYQAYIDREHGRLVGISLWATRSDLDASGETGRQAVSKVAELGAVVVGEMQILELAFDARPLPLPLP